MLSVELSVTINALCFKVPGKDEEKKVSVSIASLMTRNFCIQCFNGGKKKNLDGNISQHCFALNSQFNQNR